MLGRYAPRYAARSGEKSSRFSGAQPRSFSTRFSRRALRLSIVQRAPPIAPWNATITIVAVRASPDHFESAVPCSRNAVLAMPSERTKVASHPLISRGVWHANFAIVAVRTCADHFEGPLPRDRNTRPIPLPVMISKSPILASHPRASLGIRPSSQGMSLSMSTKPMPRSAHPITCNLVCGTDWHGERMIAY